MLILSAGWIGPQLDKRIITSETFTATLLMALASIMLSVPAAAPKLARLGTIISKAS
ncbi:MAG TPA: hypothetical protein VH207_12140 [Chthoniobacterales bacterium]|jgi:hypothetical protein|nr:hypothetical protein [Chthoniobacterales bacterium]